MEKTCQKRWLNQKLSTTSYDYGLSFYAKIGLKEKRLIRQRDGDWVNILKNPVTVYFYFLERNAIDS